MIERTNPSDMISDGLFIGALFYMVAGAIVFEIYLISEGIEDYPYTQNGKKTKDHSTKSS